MQRSRAPELEDLGDYLSKASNRQLIWRKWDPDNLSYLSMIIKIMEEP